jgi:hypothetical protein
VGGGYVSFFSFSFADVEHNAMRSQFRG